MKKVKVIQSRMEGTWFERLPDLSFIPDTYGQENQLLMVYPDVTYQTVQGFGSAFTQAAAYNYSFMPPAVREEFLEACFSENGLNYTLGRIPIGSCDFSRESYSYCTEGDEELKSFSVEKDEEELLPLVRAAEKKRGKTIPLFASPWSPPAWMKSNHNLLHGGTLLPKFYGTYANYLVKYLQAYRQKGFDVRWMTVQNEAKAVQRWESCVYTPEEEKAFVQDALAPALAKAGIDTKIFIWDHNKERVYLRAKELFADEAVRHAVGGIAFHWYSGDHFDNLRLCREQYPEKDLFFTEGCVELSGGTSMSEKATKGGSVNASNAPWKFGECYAHDMIGNFNAGASAFLDWNMVLDEHGGPNHAHNYCSAPIIYHSQTQKLIFQPSFCFIGHLSRYIPQGARLTAHSVYTSALQVSSFVTANQEIIVVVLNEQPDDVPFILKDTSDGNCVKLTAPARSITTLQYYQL